MTEIFIEEHLLNASELFHYAFRFRNSRFVVAIPEVALLEKLIPDLSVIQHSRIATVVVCSYSIQNERELAKLHSAGSCFHPLIIGCASELPEIAELEDILKRQLIPVLLCKEHSIPTMAFFKIPVIQVGLNVAKALNANKLFMCGDRTGLEVAGSFYSAPQLSELERFAQSDDISNFSKPELIFLKNLLEQEFFDMVVLKAETGMLFQEIFTHLGAGTLISKYNSLSCRQAELSDVPDICLLLKPAIRTGSILPIGESEVIDQISNFYVYTSNSLIVASACLKDYGECYEISKVCTFPRYQGRGLARGLVRELFAKASSDGKRYVFALSVTERMWSLFHDLGFSQVEKSELPLTWLNNYDHSRPSRAYKREL